MPMCSLKKRSARAMGSPEISRTETVWTCARGVIASVHADRGIARADDMAGEQAEEVCRASSTTGKVRKLNPRSSIIASTSPMAWSGKTLIGS